MQSLQNPGSALEDDFPMGGTNAIRDGLAAILDFKDNFSFHREYPDAPGPGLCLSDLGVVGLPLSKREAEVVKTHCIQAPVRKGERVFDDKTVQDTWEMDASQVKLENPRWSEFLLRIAQEVCQALAIDFTAGRPRCKLCKLRLYETGSRFLPDADTEKQDGVFATIEIVLPSKFTGGTTHFSQGELSNMYDCSPSSQHNTSVLAWCTGVSHETKPTTSGYRLALSYDLIHTTQSLRPALSAKTDLTDRLRAILMTWKKDKGRGHPLKLLYLLDRTYPQADLRVSALKGADAYKVAMLDTLAKETGFRLGFASVEFHQSGIADEDRDRGSSHYAFAEIDDATISITNFVDVEGKLIRDALEFDEETEGIPEYMTDGIEDGPVDEEDYDGVSVSSNIYANARTQSS
ncbi:hypothetical protein BDY19DRAFT_1070864 [Irpex rosettiformis]|uniref:Uncharacterized protein n=1 Tax=Irpex rosettiformis TaxID=378272 RepID=A0ACB8U4N6_9APHY|nr:hypothetical protein BDY19DRAFT_1070864 [Irpex rosettiformis]